jgi:hypothetical protein
MKSALRVLHIGKLLGKWLSVCSRKSFAAPTRCGPGSFSPSIQLIKTKYLEAWLHRYVLEEFHFQLRKAQKRQRKNFAAPTRCDSWLLPAEYSTYKN